MTTLPRTARLLFAGGGTGGHLFPAIAIADRVKELLRSSDVTIEFVGTKYGIEYRIRESIGYPLRLINIRGLARSFTLKNLLVPFLVVSSLLKCRAIIRDFRPDIVVGTGGYVSWPVVRAAAGRGVTTVVQEQNSFPGVATRELADRATKVYLGFEEAKRHLPPKTKTLLTGNPVRRAVVGGNRAEALQHFGLDAGKKTILVIGGSQGARSINQAVLKSVLAGSLTDSCQLLWQTGKRDYKDVVTQVGEKCKGCSLFPFENNMHLVYAAADLAIARAGAITLAELEACQVPAILIPYPHAAGDHQRRNAAAYASRGFGEVVEDGVLADRHIVARAVAMFEDGSQERMKQALASANTGRKPALDVIAEDIIALIAESQASPGSQESRVAH